MRLDSMPISKSFCLFIKIEHQFYVTTCFIQIYVTTCFIQIKTTRYRLWLLCIKFFLFLYNQFVSVQRSIGRGFGPSPIFDIKPHDLDR